MARLPRVRPRGRETIPASMSPVWPSSLVFPRERERRRRPVADSAAEASRAAPRGPTRRRLAASPSSDVVPSLHRRLRSARLPRLIDLDQCTGSDHPVVEFLRLMADQNIDLKPDPNGRIAEMIRRKRAIAAALKLSADRVAASLDYHGPVLHP